MKYLINSCSMNAQNSYRIFKRKENVLFLFSKIPQISVQHRTQPQRATSREWQPHKNNCTTVCWYCLHDDDSFKVSVTIILYPFSHNYPYFSLNTCSRFGLRKYNHSSHNAARERMAVGMHRKEDFNRIKSLK